MVMESGISVSSLPVAEPEPAGASAAASTMTLCDPVRVAVTPPVSVLVTVTVSARLASELAGACTAKLSRVARISAAVPAMV